MSKNIAMAEDVNVKVIRKTQEKLGKYIKKPPLQEKLLKRPPFRFLHDIITNIIKSTSFLKGLYTPEELVSDNVKDKESKIQFLQKAIDALIMVTGDKLEVKPSKIVAGHEAEKTNEFLQCFAKALKSKADSSEAVQKVLNGEKPERKSKKSPTKKVDVASPEKKDLIEDVPLDKVQNGNEDNEAMEELGNKSARRKESSRKSDRASSRNPDRIREKSRMKEDGSGAKVRSKDKSRSSHSTRRRSSHHSSKNRNEEGSTNNEIELITEEKPPIEDSMIQEDTEPNKIEMPNDGQNLSDDPRSPEKAGDPTTLTDDRISDEPKNPRKSSIMKDHRLVTPRPPSAKGPRRRSDEDGGNNDTEALNDSTPKREKKLRDVLKSAKNRENSAVNEPTPPPPTAASVRSARPTRPSSAMLKSARPSSARPAPPRIHRKDVIEEPQVRPESVKPPENIILQDDEEGSEDETFLVTKDAVPDNPTDTIQNEVAPGTKPEDLADDVQGSLVKQLLATKKDLEGGSQTNTQPTVVLEKPVVDNSQRRRQHEIVAKEIEKLQTCIQTLTRSANPLGKLMDYLQEDIDSMQKEWHLSHQQYMQDALLFKQEEKKVDDTLEPLRVQLSDLDSTLEDQQIKIHNLKSKIIHSEEKLEKFLCSINLASK